jgi:hypothetical protein
MLPHDYAEISLNFRGDARIFYGMTGNRLVGTDLAGLINYSPLSEGDRDEVDPGNFYYRMADAMVDRLELVLKEFAPQYLRRSLGALLPALLFVSKVSRR